MRYGGRSTWNGTCTEHRTGTASSGTLRTGGRSIRTWSGGSPSSKNRARLISITLFDSTRNIRVRLPIDGGQVFFRQGAVTTWTRLVNTSVDRIERTFSDKQRATLRQDREQARQMLNRVNRRLDEAVIMPTSVVDDMRRKVRNIFHINLDATLPDVLTESIHFGGTLVPNFRALRSAGFNNDPPFVFEPDYIGTLVAWVVGIDNPNVHISPNHFYMDREGLILTLVHERAHTVLRLNGHPGGNSSHQQSRQWRALDEPRRRSEKRVLLRVVDGGVAAHDLTRAAYGATSILGRATCFRNFAALEPHRG